MSADNNGTHPTLDPVMWLAGLVAAAAADGEFDEGSEVCILCGSPDHEWTDCDEFEDEDEL